MQTFMTAVDKYSSPLFASNGGPIFMLQVENEYDNIAHAFPSDDAIAYMKSLVEHLVSKILVKIQGTNK